MKVTIRKCSWITMLKEMWKTKIFYLGYTKNDSAYVWMPHLMPRWYVDKVVQHEMVHLSINEHMLNMTHEQLDEDTKHGYIRIVPFKQYPIEIVDY
jgi:hypothetical protein